MALSSDVASNSALVKIAVEPGQVKTEVAVQLVERSDGAMGYKMINPHQVNRVHDPQDLVELARTIQKSEEFVRARAVGRLEIIAEQIKHLQDQARRVLKEAQRDDILHHAACNFKKVAGMVYHLYQRQSGQKYFSMISPEEFGSHSHCPHNFLGSYKLEGDMSWTPAHLIETRQEEIALLDKIINAHKNMTAPPILGAEGPLPATLNGGIQSVTVEEEKMQ